jgi:hypothetical protein
MRRLFKTWWKFSKYRFYYLNAKWNYSFWLFAEKVYINQKYIVNTDEYETDYTLKLYPKKKTIQKRRFIGYRYKTGIYLDNPGIQNIESDVWQVWKNKKLVD